MKHMKHKKIKVHKEKMKHHDGKMKHHEEKMKEHKEKMKHHESMMKKEQKKSSPKKITVALGVKVSRGKEEKMREKPGSSSAGKYKHVAPKDFAGKAGGASKYSFPIPDLAHARNALARAHFAPNPEGIKAKVYKMYPELKKRAEARKKKED